MQQNEAIRILEKEDIKQKEESPLTTEGENPHRPITSFSDADKPREKMVAQGARALSDSELLAILIGSGTPKKTAIEVCQELLSKTNNSLKSLYEMDWRSMTKINGIGMAKAITIKAALEIGHRIPNDPNTKTIFRDSKDIYNYIKPDLEYLATEEIWIIFLKSNNQVIGKHRMSSGGQTRTIFDVKLIMYEILMQKANSVVMAHNHPSGSIRPSNDDRLITKSLKEACKLFDIRVLDHLIIGDCSYYSFSDNNEACIL